MASGKPTTTPISPEKQWHSAFPAPESTAAVITRETFVSWLQAGQVPGKDFVLVDVRRIDYEGGTICGAINLPAQSLYATIPTLYTLFSTAGVKNVVWFCGSSKGRGTRAGGWFADYISSQNDTTMQSNVLQGGIKGWVAAGDEYIKLMDGFDASVWKSS
ncbi:Rhodanese-like domain-containing protein [Limtongia smithiae]|uniref:Rhodanese-like domain-containing protein n=1 Tax=Limtongia smithiae TaxID=1125753 RepID=UPI0034CFF9ED